VDLIDHIQFDLDGDFDGVANLPVVVCDRIDPAPGPWNCYDGDEDNVPPCYAGKWCLFIYPASECACPLDPQYPYATCTDSGGICGCAILFRGCPDSPGTTFNCVPHGAWIVCGDYSWVDVGWYYGYGP